MQLLGREHLWLGCRGRGRRRRRRRRCLGAAGGKVVPDLLFRPVSARGGEGGGRGGEGVRGNGEGGGRGKIGVAGRVRGECMGSMWWCLVEYGVE
jgi:hypothetical protein